MTTSSEAQVMYLKVENYFGGCVHCGQTDGYTNVGGSHWFFCRTHKTKWCIGENLFSSWRDETEAEQRRSYEEIGLGAFTEIEPLPCTDPAEQVWSSDFWIQLRQLADAFDRMPPRDQRRELQSFLDAWPFMFFQGPDADNRNSVVRILSRLLAGMWAKGRWEYRSDDETF